MSTGIDVVACYAARGHGDGDIDFEADKFGLKREERGQP